ncbi:hypothetical protein, partial [Endozoicomonas sp. ONNA1]|uniref:hypothetical protein n=1 Tax=Endozoicomonas sp. ONNA1 TaxID=2828740 RepID=UPI00214900E3
MNVVHGAGISASPCPHPQSNSDTRSVTASGRWAVGEPTNKLLPRHPREYERQELLRAAESGRLAFRRIGLSKEANYFSGKGTPRPFTLALPGRLMPTERVPDTYGEWMIGTVDPQCLYIYKHSASTRDLLQPGVTPDHLATKLLPHLQSLFDNRFDRGSRILWRVYPTRFTSGHLQADGTFSLPKLKFSDHSSFPEYPELVLNKYSREDIKCFCVYNDGQRNITDILLNKRQCEYKLQLKPLPLVVYCNRTGSVQVYFDDELDNKHLARNEHSLDDFTFSQDIAPDHFRDMLNLLPMSLRAEALNSELTVSPDVMHKLKEAIELVSDPRCYHYQRLLELKQSGLPIHQRFFHKGTVQSLLDKLLISEQLRSGKCEQNREQEKEACRILHLLLQSGAGVGISVDQIYKMDNINHPSMPAGVFNYMVAAFGPFDFLTLKHLKRIPFTGCPGSIVEFDRICRDNTQPQRQKCLKRALRYVVSLPNPTLEYIQSNLLALFHYKASLDQDMLNSLKFGLKRNCRNGETHIDGCFVDDYIQWVEKLWKQRETHPYYQNWPKLVQQSKGEINDLRQSLGLDDSRDQATPLTAEPSMALQFVVDAFSKPPVLPENVGDNEKTILKVLQHYYRRPGPE